MTTITAMDFRKRPGYYFFRIMNDHESFLITHQGKPIARLNPIGDTTVIEKTGRIRGERPLTMGRRL